MQVLPAAHLRTYIKHYLWIDKASSLESRLRMFGDGNPGIVFCCEGRLYIDAFCCEPYPAIFGYGQVGQFRQIYAPGAVKLLIVVLQPFALASLTGIPAWECCDELLEPSDMFSVDAYEQLLLPEPLAVKIGRVEQLFSTLFGEAGSTSLSRGEALVSACVAKIRATDDPMRSAQLEQFSGYSERYLEKLFKQHVGIGPKKFTRITRLLQYTKQLRTSRSLTDCAYETGYFDQAHLNHEFKALTGLTPTTYKQQTQQTLALNLLAFKQL